MHIKVTTIRGNTYISDVPVSCCYGKDISEMLEMVSEMFIADSIFFSTLDNRHMVIPTNNIESIELIDLGVIVK